MNLCLSQDQVLVISDCSFSLFFKQGNFKMTLLPDTYSVVLQVNINGPFPSSRGPLFQNEGRCSAFDMEIIFHSHASKTHLHKKGCAPSLIIFESEGFWNSEVACFLMKVEYDLLGECSPE